jgi:hypothetical protein
MVMDNGHIRTRKLSAGEPTGGLYPDKPVVSWSDPVSALISPASVNWLARTVNDNAYTDISYRVLMEYSDVLAAQLRKGERVQLEGCYQGEYSIKGLEVLKEVDLIRITV